MSAPTRVRPKCFWCERLLTMSTAWLSTHGRIACYECKEYNAANR